MGIPPVITPIPEVIVTYGMYLIMCFIVMGGVKDTINSKLQRERLNLEGDTTHAIVQSRKKLREDEPKSLSRLTNK